MGEIQIKSVRLFIQKLTKKSILILLFVKTDKKRGDITGFIVIICRLPIFELGKN